MQRGNAMTLARRTFLQLAAAAAALPALPRAATAQAWPSRPLRLVVGFPAGGTTDIAARLIGQWLSDRLGQPVVIENRPGAGANLAAETVVRAPPDGYTLLAATSSNVINTTFYQKLSFNFVRDIAMVAGVTRSPLVLEVNPSLPVKSVPELIAHAKANPGKIALASFGTGTTSHVAGELFKMTAGVDLFHVPYRGSAPLVTDLLSGLVQAAFDNLPASIEHIRAGKLRALAVGTAERSPALPDVPTVAEFLPGFEASAWVAVAAPKATPAEIVERLNREINAGLADPKIKARLAELGGTVFVGTPADFDRLVAEQTEKWGKVIRAANIKAE
jgi:tripartite-type tricarboxylate transporter receptor subunit TctC